MVSIKNKVTKLIYLYFVVIESTMNFVFSPISDFLGGYSKSLGDFVYNISILTANMVAILPIFVSSFSVGFILTNGTIQIDMNANIDPVILLSSILLIGSLTAFFIAYFITKHGFVNSMYLSSLLFTGGVLVNYFSPPALYIVIGGIAYGIGGYTASVIEFENPLSHEYVYDDLKPQEDVLKITTLLCVPIIGIYIGATQFAQLNTIATVGIAGLIGIISFGLSYLQRSKMDAYYRNINLNMMSQFWVLTPRLSIIIGLALVIQNAQITNISFGLLSTPVIFGFLFYTYIDSIADKVLGNRYLGGSDGFNVPFRITPSEDVDVEKATVSDSSAQLSTQINISISEHEPDKLQPWLEFLNTAHHLNRSVDTMTRSDSEDLSQFYNELTDKVINMQNGTVDYNSLPKELRKDIISRQAENNNITNQDIMDIDVKSRELNKIDANEYASI